MSALGVLASPANDSFLGSAGLMDASTSTSLQKQLESLERELRRSREYNVELETKLASVSDTHPYAYSASRTSTSSDTLVRSSFGANRTNDQTPRSPDHSKRYSPARHPVPTYNVGRQSPSPPPEGALPPIPSDPESSPQSDRIDSLRVSSNGLPKIPLRHSSSKPLKRSRRQSSLSQIPVAVVGSGRVLTGMSASGSSRASSTDASPDLGSFSPLSNASATFSPAIDRDKRQSALPVGSGLPRPASPSKATSKASPNLTGNPFYGAGFGGQHAARVASSVTGTSRVIDNLQGDLAAMRGAFEECKAQLRLSQRAIEALNRQVSDLTDARERSKAEHESLLNRYQRKERMLEDVLHRARTAEAGFEGLKDETALAQKRAKELEVRTTEAEARAAHDRSRYEALKSGHAGMRDEFKRGIAALRKDLEVCQQTHASELAAAKAAHDRLVATQTERESIASDARTTIASLEGARNAFLAEWTPQLVELSNEIKRSSALNAQSLQQTEDVASDLQRIRRNMRDFRSDI